MAIARTLAVTLAGVTGQIVEVEADISAGLPGLSFTGLADVSVVEARDRIRAALLNSGATWPNHRITLALLPADVRKVGSRMDLALAVAVLAAAGSVPTERVRSVIWIGELGLDGALRPVRGVLPSVLAAQQAGIGRVVVSAANAAEAALVNGVDVRAVADLGSVIAWLRGEVALVPVGPAPVEYNPPALVDLSDVVGQAAAKRALEVAAAGGHHLHLTGAPGSGKSMLAARLPGLLPQLNDEQALEVTAVHSVAGRLPDGVGLIRRAPLQAPHHSASAAALVGGGSGLARPGAISLAHQGILFLDEAAEFKSAALDSLREPLESGHIVIHRAGGSVRYPARFLLVLASNPCPCGSRQSECICSPAVRRRYQQRLSGPLLDRIDIRVQVDPVPNADLLGEHTRGETSTVVAERVRLARAAAAERWAGCGWRCNADVPGSTFRRQPWRLPRNVVAPVESYLDRGQLSARGFDRVLRLAWTIADLTGHDRPDAGDVAEAVFFRTGRSGAWAA